MGRSAQANAAPAPPAAAVTTTAAASFFAHRPITCGITKFGRIVEAVSKELVAQETAICTNKCHIIRIDKSADAGIVVTAPEAVEICLYGGTVALAVGLDLL